MKYSHIVFDLDGTLIDTERAILPSLRDTLEELTGRHYKEQALTFALGITGADALKRLGVADVPAALTLWIEKCTNMKMPSRCSSGWRRHWRNCGSRGWRWVSSPRKPGRNLPMILTDLALVVISKP